MGGIGSGRHWQYGKDTTSDCRFLDVRRLQRDGLLKPGLAYGWFWKRDSETVASINIRTEAGKIILNYRQRSGGGEWKQEDYPVYLQWSPCHFGGQRPWFSCPARGCGRRTALLYIGSAGIFACRRCYQLAYASQRENVFDRAGRRAEKIRDRLGWEAGILNGNGSKPKGMHWRTYRRLVAEHNDHADYSLLALYKLMGLPFD